MPKYKQIKSIAHNFSHSFTSMMNFGDREYIMDQLITVMFKNNLDKITLDIMDAHFEPEITRTEDLANSVNYYCNYFFPHLLEAHGLSKRNIETAEMTLKFQFLESYLSKDPADWVRIPYHCQTQIQDDRSRTHIGEVSGGEGVQAERIGAVDKWLY